MSSQPAFRPRRTTPQGGIAPARLRLAPPPAAPSRRTVERPRLVMPLVEDPRPLAVVVAPAGYGKTTALAEWRDRDPRPFAWLSAATAHDDAPRLLAAVAQALAGNGPSAARPAARGATLDDVARALAHVGPSVLVVDDVETLRSEAPREVVAQLAACVPPGSTLALASRHEAPLRLGRARAQDEVRELRAARLAMTRPEVAELLSRAGLALGARQIERLLELTEGWPAMLALAVRALGEQDDVAAALDAFDGADGIVGDYVREEVLAALAPADRAFLRRTAVLGRLGGPVCDALLERRGSATTLRKLVHLNVPLVALDRAELEYRQHPLLRQALRAELRRVEPELMAQLQARASAWYEGRGEVEAAIAQAVAARDADRAGELLDGRVVALVAAGGGALVDAWLDRLGDAAVAARPSLALAAAVARLARGETDAAERWATIARDGSPQAAVGARLVLAWVARGGVEQMRADPPEDRAWRSLARLVDGSRLCLCGRTDDAIGALEEGARQAVLEAPLIRSLCLAEVAFLKLERGELEDASTLAARARDAITSGEGAAHPLAALTFAVSALVHSRAGRLDAAREDLRESARRLAELADPPAWYGAMTRVLLARVHLKLSDAPECRRLLGEAARLRQQVAGAGALQGWIDEAWGQADDFAAGPVAYPSALTMAELRVLRLLPSHLSFREIGSRLHVSANTVKTQAHAVYRKLDARSRSEAVAHAAAIGLVDA